MNTQILKFVLILFCVIHFGPLLQAQVQRVVAGGKVSATDGEPIACAQLFIRYNGDTLFTTCTDSNGSYHIQGQLYGKIEQIDVLWEAEGYERVSYIDYNIYHLEPTLYFKMKKIPTPNPQTIILSRTHYFSRTRCVVNKPDFAKLDRALHTYWDLWTDTKPKEPLTYYPIITQKITILDTYGLPVPNTLVSVKVPDDEARWGYTDENGKLTLYMHFYRGARFATVSVFADGYAPLKLRRQELNVHTQSVYQLQKKS